jgi:hypothetical protein
VLIPLVIRPEFEIDNTLGRNRQRENRFFHDLQIIITPENNNQIIKQ